MTLESWKEIAEYLQRNTTTARRWEKEEGLPVHRHPHKSRNSVYAYPSEIDAWRAGRRIASEPQAEAHATWWRPVAMGVTALLCLIMVGNGIRPVAAQEKPQSLRQVWSGKALDGYATPSPDGRYLVFTDWSNGNLAVRDLTSGSTQVLAESGYKDGEADHSAISPDGKMVAYAWINFGTSATELRLLPFMGGKGAAPRILHQSNGTKYIQPAGWTPDGKQLLVLRTLRDRSSQIVMLSLQDGSLRVLKSFGWRRGPGNASLSPDGRYIAYDAPASDDVPTHDVFVLAADGSKESRVADSPALDWSPQWSPDGSRVLFLSDRTGSVSLWSVPIESGKKAGEAALVKTDIGPVVLLGMTRDGALYYNSGVMGRRNSYIADLDAAGKAQKPAAIAAGQFVNSNRGPAFSPDGKFLAYFTFRVPTDETPGSAMLVIQTLKTGKERQIALPSLRIPAFANAAPPRWFPDGRSVLLRSYDMTPGVGFYRVTLENGSVELVHHTASPTPLRYSTPDLSPDGRVIFYIDAGKGLRVDLSTRRETELVQPSQGQSLNSMTLSPDGSQVAYGMSDSKQTTVLYVMPSAGGAPHEVYRAEHWANGSRFSLAWSQDQRYLIFARAAGAGVNAQELWRVPVAGGEPETLGIAMLDVFFPQMSPDGRQIAFTSRDNDAQEIWALENFLTKKAGK